MEKTKIFGKKRRQIQLYRASLLILGIGMSGCLAAQDAPGSIAHSEVEKRLSLYEAELSAIYDREVRRSFDEQVRQLDLRYFHALDRSLENATKAGNLEEAVAIRSEKERITDNSGVPGIDGNDEPASVKQLRATYRIERKKLEAERDLAAAPLLKENDEKLAAYQTLLTTEGRLDEALLVKAARETAHVNSVGRPAAAEDDSKALSPIFEEGILGHVVGDATSIRHFPDNANLVIDGGLMKNGDETIREARKRGLKVVLQFRMPELVEAETKGIQLAVANRDVVVGMAWNQPYYDGLGPDDLTRFGKLLKNADPELQFWGVFVEKPNGRHQGNPVPPEVDVVVIATYGGGTIAKLNEKALDCYARWTENALTRPVLILWSAWAPKPPGLIPMTESGTMKALQEIRDRFGMKGLIIDHFGDVHSHDGLETSRSLLREISELNRQPQSPTN